MITGRSGGGLHRSVRSADQQGPVRPLGGDRDGHRWPGRPERTVGDGHRDGAAYGRVQAEQAELGRIGEVDGGGHRRLPGRLGQRGTAGQPDRRVVAAHQQQRGLPGQQGAYAAGGRPLRQPAGQARRGRADRPAR